MFFKYLWRGVQRIFVGTLILVQEMHFSGTVRTRPFTIDPKGKKSFFSLSTTICIMWTRVLCERAFVVSCQMFIACASHCR